MQSASGVYFKLEDYAPFWLRMLVDLIDLIVYGALCIFVLAAVLLIGRLNRTAFNAIFLLWLTIAFSYFVVLKRSKFRTLGYRMGRLRIVNLDGNVPGYWSLLTRFTFGVLGR